MKLDFSNATLSLEAKPIFGLFMRRHGKSQRPTKMFIFHFNIVETIGSILPSFTSLHEQTSTGEEEEVEQGWKENE
jgi:hypothetical protein